MRLGFTMGTDEPCQFCGKPIDAVMYGADEDGPYHLECAPVGVQVELEELERAAKRANELEEE